MVLVKNDTAKPVTYTYNGVERVLGSKQGVGLSGAEAEYVSGLKLAGVSVGSPEAPAITNTSSPVSGRGPASESGDAISSQEREFGISQKPAPPSKPVRSGTGS